jgi:hypothetical protein
MEKQIALVNKITKRVENVIVVNSLSKDELKSWTTDSLDAIPVTTGLVYVHGLYDGENFNPPTNEYLIEIGLISEENQNLALEAEAKAVARQAILDRLGLTADEAKLLLG